MSTFVTALPSHLDRPSSATPNSARTAGGARLERPASASPTGRTTGRVQHRSGAANGSPPLLLTSPSSSTSLLTSHKTSPDGMLRSTSSATTETFVVTPFKATLARPAPWLGSDAEEEERPRRAHPASTARRHGPPGPVSEQLQSQLHLTARALAIARAKLDDERRRTATARKSEEQQRTLAEQARIDAERAWQSAWQSAEQVRVKREQEVASRLLHDRRRLDERLEQEADETMREFERRVALAVEERERQLPQLRTEVERLERRVRMAEERETALASEAAGDTVALAAATSRTEALERQLEKLKAESDATIAELEEEQRAALEQQRAMLSGTLEEQQKQRRMDELRGKAMRRMANQGLIAGWTTWHDMWEEVSKQKRQLAAAGMRLARPQQVAAFSKWRLSWQYAQEAEAQGISAVAQQMLEQQQRRCDELEALVEKLKKKNEQQAAEALAELRAALERQQTLLSGTLEEQQKHRRMDELKAKAMRRIANQGIMAGWTTWHEMWEEVSKQKRQLAAAGARLARPQLVKCFGSWCESWRDEQHEAKTKGHTQMLREQRQRGDALAKEVEKLTRELNGLKESLLSGEEKEKKRRLEALTQKVARRIQNHGILAGWTTWQEMWEEISKQRRQLAAAGARLARPQLVKCFGDWKESWYEEEYANDASFQAQLVEKERAMSAELRAELERLKALVRQVQKEALEELRAALEKQRSLLSGSLEEQQKQRRKDELANKAMRRIANQGIMAGWTSWHEMWEEVSKQKRQLAAAGARLARPQLVKCFGSWCESWRDEQHEAKTKGHTQMLREQRQRGDALAKEVEKLVGQLQGAREEMKQMQRQLDESDFETQRARWEEEQQQGRREEVQLRAARRIANQGLVRAWVAWHELAEEHAKQRRQLAAAGARLARPQLVKCLALWAAAWREEQGGGEARKAQRLLDAEKMRADGLQRELDALRSTNDSLAAQAAEAQRRALEHLQTELTSSHAQASKEERMQAMTRNAMRRLLQRGLLRGWEAWYDSHVVGSRRARLMASARERLLRPRLVAAMAWWHTDWVETHFRSEQQRQADALAQAREEARLTDVAQRQKAAVAIYTLEVCIAELEAQLHAYQQKILAAIPPKTARYIVLHTISAIGVPDADAAGGSDPYIRFVLHDHPGKNKEVGYTGFKRKCLDPVFTGERVQLKLALGGTRPPLLVCEVWDKDQTKPDDLIAVAEVTLDDVDEGVVTLVPKGVDGQDDVEELTFSFLLSATAEEEKLTDAQMREKRTAPKPKPPPAADSAAAAAATPARPSSDDRKSSPSPPGAKAAVAKGAKGNTPKGR